MQLLVSGRNWFSSLNAASDLFLELFEQWATI